MVEKTKFFEIELPLIDEKIELISTSEDKLAGRSIKIDLTRKLRGKSLEAIFKIKMIDNKIKAVPYRLSIFGYFIRRMMRKSISYFEDSFNIDCKNAVLKVKPFAITRQKVSRAVLNALRNKAKEEIALESKDKNYEEIFLDIIAGKFQRNLSLKLKKVYPLAFCEIRDIFVEQEKAVEIKVEKISEQVKVSP